MQSNRTEVGGAPFTFMTFKKLYPSRAMVVLLVINKPAPASQAPALYQEPEAHTSKSEDALRF